MGPVRPINSIPELFAHALAIEREARLRYLEFGRRMMDHDNPEVAELFMRLARNEIEHATRLEELAAGMELPQIDRAQYAWLDAGAPETAAHDFIWIFMRPYHVLQVALRAERRAREFFESVGSADVDGEVRALAAEFAREEQAHVEWVEAALALENAPYPDWDTASE